MSVSQFTLYQSTDAGAPQISGQTGALIAVLDAVLVNGYGSKAAAGWTKTFTGAGIDTAIYKMGAGTGFSLAVNDFGPNTGFTFQSARICGWESPTAAPGATDMGAGTGQFPNPGTSQGVSPYGFLGVWKSNTLDATSRPWFCFADNRTFYFGIMTGAFAPAYFMFSFGDFYSLAGSGDLWNCHILSRNSESSGTGQEQMAFSVLTPDAVAAGHYVARTWGGGGASIPFGKGGDYLKGGNQCMGSNQAANTVQTPNSTDNSYYVSPVWFFETANLSVRGRWRGVWHLCHPYISFSDGQTISGVNDVAGKTFMVRLPLYGQGFIGMLMFETSNTVETN